MCGGVCQIEVSCVFEETFGMCRDLLLQAVTLFVGDISILNTWYTVKGRVHVSLTMCQDDVQGVSHSSMP